MSKASPNVDNIDDDDPDAFPRPFGSYLLLQRFARGGMGEVFLGKFGAIAGLERYCVLKKLRSELTRDREYVTRFIDEARVVVTLNHANICHVFDVGRVGDEYYLAMEYISGRDIRTIQDRCRQRGRTIPPATALHIVCEVLEALDYAHRRNHPISGEPLNLVHRDVSPQNVLVSFEGEVKLIDFGLAASKLKVERTQPNVVMGKMAYMAPEQARGDPIDARADLFACGVLAYELLAGERFYEGMSANDIWQVAGRGSFVPPKWPTLDPELAKIIAKALHPDPKKRFATCGDFREELASHLHWRFPGTGVRGVRDVVNELFADEIRKERDLMSRYGRVTVASFRTTFENTQSQSITLARATDDKAASQQSTRLARNEQSSSSPGEQMPPPGSRDVHHEPTRLTTDPEKFLAREETAAAKRKDTSTAEQLEDSRASSSSPASRTTIEVAPADTSQGDVGTVDEAVRSIDESTQLVSRPGNTAKTGSRPMVRNLDLEAVTSSSVPRNRAPGLVMVGLGTLAAVAVAAFVVIDPSGTAADADRVATNPIAPVDAPIIMPPPTAPVAALVLPAPLALPPVTAPAPAPIPASVPVPVEPPPPAVPEVAATDLPMEALVSDPARDQRLLEKQQRVAAEKAARERAKEGDRLRALHEAERQALRDEDQARRTADEARRKAKDEADRKKAEQPAPKTSEELAMQCNGRCDQELGNWRRKKGDLAFRTALEWCVKKCK